MSVEGSNKVCRQSEITRATFDLHFDGLSAVVDELLEEVLNTEQRTGRPPEGDLIEFMAQLGERDDPALLMKYYDQLPACLRAAGACMSSAVTTAPTRRSSSDSKSRV